MVKRILIIEDEPDIRDFLKELLVDEGYTVAASEDGIEGLNSFKKFEPDLVILDLGLPKMSGESVCMELKKKDPNLPIILLTAKDGTPDIVKGLNLGADDYVTKPFIADVLLARIKA